MTWNVWTERPSGQIWAEFHGNLDAADGKESARVFSHLLDGARRWDVVFDIRHMTGYHRDAREAWQAALRPLRDRIACIYVVGGNPLVRMGANLLGSFLGVRMRGVRDLDGLRKVSTPPPPPAPERRPRA